MTTLQLEHIYKRYSPSLNAVEDFNLKVEDEEFIVFVGPSGCGKSTTLRMIAGLESISEGALFIGGKQANDLPSKERDIAMVFQNYALYPHMTVYDNIAFSLQIRKFPKGDIHERVVHAAKILGLEDYLDRKPRALSGGQRQRVALGRAIVRQPQLFLMDEPLSNLDAKLRLQMRAEITKLHKALKATVIYVTHDQTEAMTMGTRLVVMKDGKIQQVGTPKQIYTQPANLFVASFIGAPGMNFIKGIIKNEQFVFGEYVLPLLPYQAAQLHKQGYNNQTVILGIRPEHVTISMKVEAHSIRTQIAVAELLGADYIVYTEVNEQQLTVKVPADYTLQTGQDIHITLLLTHAHFFDSDSSVRIEITEN